MEKTDCATCMALKVMLSHFDRFQCKKCGKVHVKCQNSWKSEEDDWDHECHTGHA